MGTRQRIRIKPDVDSTPSTPRPRERVRIHSTPRIQSGPTLLDCINDPDLFTPWFKDRTTWSAWMVFIAALFALPMSDEQLATYRLHTGRNAPPDVVASESWLVCGRRAGKSFVLALIAVFLACFHDYCQYLAPGERGTVFVIATDRKQARVIMRYVRALLQRVPILSRMIEREWAEGFDLNNSVSIEIATASWKSVRGFSFVAILVDEIAFLSTEETANPDYEILNALRPGMATIPGAMLLCASSPYARRGALWDAHRTHYGKDNDPVLVWQADTRSMNPSVPQSFIDAAYAADPASASVEYGAQFRSDIEAFVSLDTIMACVSDGVHERGREAKASYVAFIDPAGGSGKDSFTLAIGHKDKTTGLFVVDCIRETKPPFSPELIVAEYAALLKSYGVNKAMGDRYAGEWVREPFKKAGISYEPAAKPKSDLYRDALPLINSKRVDLVDHDRMIQQFVGLERRTARSGKDSIDHAPGAHDDIANVVAGLLVSIGTKPYNGFDTSYRWVTSNAEAENETWRTARIQRYLNGGVFR